MISTRGRYALRVIIYLAENDNGKYIPLGEIAAKQQISEKYLENILATLTRGGILEGTRGKGGGYRLPKPPEEITVENVLRLTETSLSPVACLKDDAEVCTRAGECKTLPLWKGLQDAMFDYLRGVTLADILNGTVK